MKLRSTKQRQIVYDEVLSRWDHPTADMIYESIHKAHPNLSKSTVYRNLDILAKEGKINRIVIPGGDRFDLTIEKHFHVHCKKCGKVIDTNTTYSQKVDKIVSEETGFLVENHNVVFEGICEECQKNRQ